MSLTLERLDELGRFIDLSHFAPEHKKDFYAALSAARLGVALDEAEQDGVHIELWHWYSREGIQYVVSAESGVIPPGRKRAVVIRTIGTGPTRLAAVLALIDALRARNG